MNRFVKTGDAAKIVLEIITVFSAGLYGSRSHKNKKLKKYLAELASGNNIKPSNKTKSE